MYKRAFISISISNFKLKLAKLSKDKKVLKAASYDIPQGLVSQGRVQKSQEFALFLKQIWKKEHIRERAVGLILPEFSTFMKTISLPKLPFLELDEAIRWQVREFLPHEGKDMIIDWKIIDELSDSFEVLVVAIKTDDLSGYVGAIDGAGLLPVYVETTSLCLERLASGKDGGKIVLYRSKGTAVASVVVAKKILATSVLPNQDDSAIITSLLQIFSRYGKDKVSLVSVCGNGLTQEFVNTLHTKIGLPIELITLPVVGVNATSIQEYVIAFSQQFIDAEEPSNAYSINLLPPSWALHYKNQIRDYQLWTITLVVSVVMWLCLLSSLASYVVLSQNATAVSERKISSNTADLQSITADITKINTNVNKVDNLLKAFSYPQNVVNLIEKKKTQGIVITSYEVNVENGKVGVLGSASDRNSLLAFKQALEDTPEFSKVSLPLANLLVEQNISFTVQMDYKQVAK